MRYFYLLFFAAIMSAFAGCTFAPPVEDISEVGLAGNTGLLSASYSISLRADGTAFCDCSFYDLKEDDKPKYEYPEFCGELYRNNASAFVKNGASLQGNFSGVISKEQFERLAQLVHKNGFFALKDEYIEEGVRDAPPTSTTVIYGGKTKTVSDNTSKGGEKLSEIKTAIYETAQETKWEIERK